MSLSSWTSLFFLYSFNEAHHTSEFEFIQRRSIFSFLSVFSARHDFGIWVSSISQIMFLVFQRTAGNSLWYLHPSTKKWSLNSFCNMKIHHVLAFFSLSTNHGRRVCLSAADAYMANREWGFLMLMSACTNREGWRETLLFPPFCILLRSANG